MVRRSLAKALTKNPRKSSDVIAVTVSTLPLLDGP